jgi:hypothetical protein
MIDEPPDAIKQAALWFAQVADGPDRPRFVVPELQERFGLTALQACQALRMAHDLRRG